MGANDYHKIREKVLICDTLLSVKDSIILHQDSIIKEKDNKIYQHKLLLASKDTTIQSLNNLVNNLPTGKKWYDHKQVYWVAALSFLFGFILAK